MALAAFRLVKPTSIAGQIFIVTSVGERILVSPGIVRKSGFHPVEPDVLSVLFCVEAALLRRRQKSLLERVNDLPLFAAATDTLYDALQERFSVAPIRPPELDEERIAKVVSDALGVVRLADRPVQQNVSLPKTP